MSIQLNRCFLTLNVLALCFGSWTGLAADRGANMVILDAASVENLGVQSVVATRQTFEETLFAMGRIEVFQNRRAVVSSRVAGRITSLSVADGDWVKRGDVVAVLESRQPGNPPPSIELRAPMGGLVAHGHVRLGEPVEPDTAIFEIVDLSTVFAVAQIPEDQAGLLKVGNTARIAVAALSEIPLEGKLSRFGTAVDTESGTVSAVFAVSDPGSDIRPHMRAEFSILLKRRENVLAVPRDALVGAQIGESVFVKDFDLPHAFVKCPVQTGMKNDRYVEITQGLFPGDEVVIRGAYALSFAGAGTISLKEALDAAHGHEHNEDGSEMTAADRAKAAEAKGGVNGNRDLGGVTLFLALFCGVLLVLLLISQWQLSRLRAERREGDA